MMRRCDLPIALNTLCIFVSDDSVCGSAFRRDSDVTAAYHSRRRGDYDDDTCPRPVYRYSLASHNSQVTLTPLPTITWTLLLSVYVLFAVRVNGTVARSYTLGLYAVRVKYRVFLYCPHCHRMPSLLLRTTKTWAHHYQSSTSVLVASVRLGARESSMLDLGECLR